MDQHPVPQHIASFEFKLFGNLTARQFITLAIPMSLALIIYFSNLDTIIRLPLAGLIALFAIFAALVPINGRPLDRWVVVFIKAIIAPTQRIWVKEPKIPEFLEIVVSAVPKEEHKFDTKTVVDREMLFAYLRSLPKGYVSPLDIKEQVAIERLNLGPAGKSQTGVGKLPPPIVWSTLASLPQIETTLPVTAPAVGEAAGGGRQIYPKRFEESLPPEAPQIQKTPIPKIAPHAKPFVLAGIEKRLSKTEGKTAKTIETKEEGGDVSREPIELISFLGQGKQMETEVNPLRNLASEINYTEDFVIPLQTPDKQLRLLPGIGKTRVRKLHFAPPEGFDLSQLPIRGERRFEISEELKKRYHLDESVLSGGAPPVILPIETIIEEKKPASVKITSKIKSVFAKQTEEIPKAEVMTTHGEVTFKKQKKEEGDSKISVVGQKLSGPVSAANLSRAQIVPLTNKPNVLSGLITTRDGAPVAGAIFIVLDQNGIPVRALKTNKLGQFLSATSLPNGQYQVEVETDAAKFDPFSINLTGQVVVPLEIKAKE